MTELAMYDVSVPTVVYEDNTASITFALCSARTSMVPMMDGVMALALFLK